MNKIEAIVRPERLEQIKNALAEEGFVGLNITQVVGRGAQKGITHVGRSGETYTIDMLSKVKLEMVVREADTDKVIQIIIKSARTGNIGDGKIFVSPVSQVYRVRTGESGEAAV